MKLRLMGLIALLTVGFSIQTAHSMQNNFLVEDESPKIAPAKFTWKQLELLKEGKIVNGELDGYSLTMQLADPKELETAWPSTWQVLSYSNFASRISKKEEVQENVQPSNPEVKIQTLATYAIESNYSSLGAKDYFFKLITKLHTSKIEENRQESLTSSQIIEPSNLETIVGLQSAQVSGTYYAKRAFLNVFQIPYGNPYSPSQLRSHLFKLLGNDWINSESIYDLGYDSVPMYRYRSEGSGRYIVVSSPAHDLPEEASEMEKCSSGNLSIGTVVKSITSNPIFQSSDLKILMPVAQSNKGRRHWTLLDLDKKNKDWSISHLDSKGFSSVYYSLENMMKGLEDITYGQMNLLYLGHQGLLNLKDCPRYVTSYILNILQNKDPKDLSNEEIEKIFKSLPK